MCSLLRCKEHHYTTEWLLRFKPHALHFGYNHDRHGWLSRFTKISPLYIKHRQGQFSILWVETRTLGHETCNIHPRRTQTTRRDDRTQDLLAMRRQRYTHPLSTLVVSIYLDCIMLWLQHNPPQNTEDSCIWPPLPYSHYHGPARFASFHEWTTIFVH